MQVLPEQTLFPFGQKRSVTKNFGAGQDKSTYQLRQQEGNAKKTRH